MHPRNIYKESARAVGHAEKDPYVSQFLIEEKGKKRFGSLDEKALRQLSKILLREDFNLDIDFPPTGLIPTIPLRLNYILWLEDLLHDFGVCSQLKDVVHLTTPTDDRIRGIDIGTGGSAVYAVLAARKNNWLMLGTETNFESYEYATKNVTSNNLGSDVTVLQVNPSNYFDQAKAFVGHAGIIFDFSMCNPPFFASPEETDSTLNSRTDHRPPPPNEKTGAGGELYVEGGEIKFVSDMIVESLKFKSNVRIFTTMIGVKAHLPILIKLLKQHQIPNITMTEFVQGRTRRWGLAWSFYHNHKTSYRNVIPDKLSNIWISGVPNPPKAIKAEISIEGGLIALQDVIDTMFEDLKLILIHSTESNYEGVIQVELEYVGAENTWSNMRRRRREQARALQQKAEAGEEGSKSPKQIKTDEDCTDAGDQKSPIESTPAAAENEDKEEQKKDDSLKRFEFCNCVMGLVHFSVMLRPRSPVAAEATFVHLEGTLGPEGMHQVFQYMKNCLQKNEKVTSVVLSH